VHRRAIQSVIACLAGGDDTVVFEGNGPQFRWSTHSHQTYPQVGAVPAVDGRRQMSRVVSRVATMRDI
jgi:hypothetical protein